MQNEIVECAHTRGVKSSVVGSMLNNRGRLSDSQGEHVCCFRYFSFFIAWANIVCIADRAFE